MSKSIVTEYEDISAFSGKPAECRHHLVFGNANRSLADKDGLWIPLTNNEHNAGSVPSRIHGNSAAAYLSRIAGQLAWEKEFYKRKCGADGDPAREEFRRRYKESHL